MRYTYDNFILIIVFLSIICLISDIILHNVFIRTFSFYSELVLIFVMMLCLLKPHFKYFLKKSER